MKKTLISLTAMLGAIPGIGALALGFGTPPDSSVLFGIVLEVVGGSVLLAIILLEDRISGWSKELVAVGVLAGGIVAVVMFMGYQMAYEAAVVEHHWRTKPEAVLVPYRISSWAPPKLDSLVACTPVSSPCQQVGRDYNAKDVAQAINKYGPDEILPLLSDKARSFSVAALLLLYSLMVAVLVFSFGAAASRITSSRDSQTARSPGQN